MLKTKLCHSMWFFRRKMSISNVLSEDEVETLLDNSENTRSGEQDGQQLFDSFNFGKSSSQSIDGFTKFETINEVFCREGAINITHFLCKKTTLEANTPEVMPFDEFIKSLERPLLINYVNIKPLGGLMLVIFSNKLVSTLIEILFGGHAKDEVNNERDFGVLEMRLGRLLVELLNRGLTPAFEIIKNDLEFQYVKSIINPSLVNVIAPKENTITTKMNLVLDNIPCEFYMCYPYTTLEPIKHLLRDSATSGNEHDKLIWSQALHENLQSVPLTVDAFCTEVEITLKSLMELKEGDVLPISDPNHAIVEIDQNRVFSGRCMNNGGNRAIVIEENHLE